MIICVCNNISNAKINEAIHKGSLTPNQVYNACGCRPKCGSCKDFIQEQIILKTQEIEKA